MIRFIFFILIIGFSVQAYHSEAMQADGTQQDKRYILELLQKRKSLFNEYSSLNELKSGIFKNRTKKDVMKSKDMLNNIIALDNKIISELDRMFEHNQFQKLSLGVDMIDYELKLDQYRENLNALQSEILIIKTQNEELELQLSQGKFWKYLFVLLSIGLGAGIIYLLVKNRNVYF